MTRLGRIALGGCGYALLLGTVGVVVLDSVVFPGALWARVVPSGSQPAGEPREGTIGDGWNAIARPLAKTTDLDLTYPAFDWRKNRATVEAASAALDKLVTAEDGFLDERDGLAPRADDAFSGRLAKSPLAETWRRLRGWEGVSRTRVTGYRESFQAAIAEVDRANAERAVTTDPRFDIRDEAKSASEVSAWVEGELRTMREREKELETVKAAVLGG